MTGLKAGSAYFAAVFALGFTLGTLRVLVVEPRFGSMGAVALELPIMLAASWLACHWILRKLRVPDETGSRLAMGATAFGLLMLAELGVSIAAFGRSPAEHFATYRSGSALMGLAAQLVFAAMPLLVRSSRPWRAGQP